MKAILLVRGWRKEAQVHEHAVEQRFVEILQPELEPLFLIPSYLDTENQMIIPETIVKFTLEYTGRNRQGTPIFEYKG